MATQMTEMIEHNTNVAAAHITQVGADEWIVPSRRVVGVVYRVRRRANQTICTCPSATYRGRCWHTAEVDRMYPAPAQAPAAQPERKPVDNSLGLALLRGQRIA